MNSQYIKPAAAILIWGVILFLAGGAMSGYLSSMAIAEQISAAMSPFGISSADSYLGGAAIFGLASLTGFILMLVGGWRLASRIDQQYDVWFSQRHQLPNAQGGRSGVPLPQSAQQQTATGEYPQYPQEPVPSQHPRQMQSQQYRPSPPPPQQPPRDRPQS